MAFNPLTGYSRNNFNINTASNLNVVYGRVVDVILDSFHPLYDTYGKSQAINGVLYREVSINQQEDEEQELSFAFQGNTGVKYVPLKNEIVQIEFKPDYNRTGLSTKLEAYWTSIIPIWNHPHHNASPDIFQNIDELSNDPDVDLGEYFIETDQVNPLQPFPGDTLIEGRQGQSLRFTGAAYPSNTLVNESNSNQPVILISNGQAEAEAGFESILEDINQDFNSLYFVSNHQVPLNQANLKQDAFNIRPTSFNEYVGNQVLLNGGRLVFNAKENDILLSAKNNVAITSNILGLDAEEYIGLDSKKIFLGIKARRFEDEPLLLGTTTVNWLNDLAELLETVLRTMATLPGTPPAAIAKFITTGNASLSKIQGLRSDLNKLKSTKVFTE